MEKMNDPMVVEKLKNGFGFISKFLLHDLDLQEPEPEIAELAKKSKDE